MQNAPAPTQTTGELTTTLNEELSRVDAHVDGDLVGFSAYEVCDDGSYSFHHTEVFEEYSGHGYGKELAAGVVDIARDNGFLIAPTCPFLRKYLDKHPDTEDVRAA
jgi:predicted GNAT family acetyltransferase